MITVKLKGNDPSHTAQLTNAIVAEYESVKLGTQNLKLDNDGQFYEQRLPEVETDLRAAEVALAEFRTASATFDSDVQRRAKLGQIDTLETRLLDLEIEIADQLKRYTISHPTPKRTQKEIDTLRTSIRTLRGQISRAPNTERELRILEEDVDAIMTVNSTNSACLKSRPICGLQKSLWLNSERHQRPLIAMSNVVPNWVRSTPLKRACWIWKSKLPTN